MKMFFNFKYYIYSIIVYYFCYCIYKIWYLIGTLHVNQAIIGSIFWTILAGIKIIHARKWILQRLQCPEYIFIFFSGIFTGVITIPVIGEFLCKIILLIPFEIYEGVIFILPLILLIYQVIKSDLKVKNKKDRLKDRGVLDNEITSVKDDRLFMGQISLFAERVRRQQGGSVFGIEGKWGIGKSSFVNLCCEYLKNEYPNEIHIYKFNPLQYDDSRNVLDNFCMNLISSINAERFEPELIDLLESYIKKVLMSVSEQSIYGLKIKIPQKAVSMEETYDKLKKRLNSIDFDIIIVIDDLDRVDFLTIKRLFFMMRNVFRFPNLKFILCYDVDNIIWSAGFISGNFKNHENEQKIREFIDKYIDISHKLYHSKSMYKYFIELSDEICDGKKNIDPVLWKLFNNGIKNLFKEKNFNYGAVYMNTPRSIKRILNNILNICLDREGLSDYDFNANDLANLLLIYIYHHSLFRKIYNEETNGRYGFFSVRRNLENMNEENSAEYKEFVKTVSFNEHFLLMSLFEKKEDISSSWYSSACFNMPTIVSDQGNLEKYLRLIAQDEIPLFDEQFVSYRNQIEQSIIIKNSITMEDLKELFDKFSSNKTKVWRILANTPGNQFDEEKIYIIIKYIIDELTHYKIIERENRIGGFHLNLLIYIGLFLDKIPLAMQKSPMEMTDRYLTHITKYIFSTNNKDGILCMLNEKAKYKNYILCLFDLLYFRQSVDIQHRELFNVADALVKYENKTINLSGMDTKAISKIELRKISQEIYNMLKETLNEIDIFTEFDRLELGMLSDINDHDEVKNDILRNSMILSLKCFIFYQISNINEGMGRYDESGKEDQHGINRDFSQYLISQCFSIKDDIESDEDNLKACIHFIEFLMISYFIANPFNIQNFNYISEKTLTTMISLDILVQYWRKNRTSIRKILKKADFSDKILYWDKQVIAYKDFLDKLLEGLDNIIQNKIS